MACCLLRNIIFTCNDYKIKYKSLITQLLSCLLLKKKQPWKVCLKLARVVTSVSHLPTNYRFSVQVNKTFWNVPLVCIGDEVGVMVTHLCGYHVFSP